MISQLNIALVRKQRGSLMCLAYFFEMLSMGVCTTRHWQMSDRLVQELNVSIVANGFTGSFSLNTSNGIKMNKYYSEYFILFLT